MATNTLSEVKNFTEEDAAPQLGHVLRVLLTPLASLKITVVCFALSIFLVFAGTLAQMDRDVWQVMGEFFRTWWAWVPLQIFVNLGQRFLPFLVPETAPIEAGFYFPGGFQIGLVMLVNLFAAHLLRFKLQARGARLLSGVVLLAVGVLATWFVIASGSNKNGIEGEPVVPYSVLWQICKWGVVALAVANVVVLMKRLGAEDNDRPSDRVLRRVLGGTALALGSLAATLIYLGDAAELSSPSMRILWQLMKGGMAGLVLLAGCALLFRKRAGIVLLHGGVALMMINELVVYSLHNEGVMQIREGETVNFAQDSRSIELALVDRSAADHDDVVVVPQAVLQKEEVIHDEQLPVDLKVLKYLQNAEPRKLKPGEKSLADAGEGKLVTVDPLRPVSGTSKSGKMDLPAVYVNFQDKQSGQSLGTHLLRMYSPSDQERVTIDGKTYELSLRHKRDYKPYAVHLYDVRSDMYMGTHRPRNYSSDVRLIDPERHVDRKVHIWMNNPLRYAGETLYQSNADGEITGLQVVRNTGWMIPYVGCMIVGTGMLAQFYLVLTRFLRRRVEDAGKEAPRAASKRRRREADEPFSLRQYRLPLAVVAAAVAWLAMRASPRETPKGEMAFDEFGRLPVVFEGRMKPFDTLARNALQAVSDRDYFVDTSGKKRPAVEWLLDLVTGAPAAHKCDVLRIQSQEVLQMLGLKPHHGLRYPLEAIADNKEFEKQVRLAREVKAEERDPFQRKIAELWQRLSVIQLVRAAFVPPRLDDSMSKEELQSRLFEQLRIANEGDVPLAVPPDEQGEEWLPYGMASSLGWLMEHKMHREPRETVAALEGVFHAYAKSDAERFNTALSRYRSLLRSLEKGASHSSTTTAAEHDPAGDYSQRKLDFEFFVNRFAPFYQCEIIYIAAFLLAAGAWLGWTTPLNRTAFWLIAVAFVVHTFGIVARVYISGRPPVTNLYSVAIFVGWGSVLLGLVLERIFKLGIGNVVAAVSGYVTLLIASILAGLDGGDTFTVLQAVLDTQFWLSTHVVCITLGYTTTFVAGLLGLIYILRGLFTPSLAGQVRHELVRMTYGVLCFAIFFSFVGTVLGGLWADDSWGRFWGWDPKENGALIIVLWNALVLHARWDGLIKDRGLAVLAVAGNIAVGWSMFGVNQLDIGLHSYGVVDGVALALTIFAITQLGVVALGTLPKRLWLSHQAEAAAGA